MRKCLSNKQTDLLWYGFCLKLFSEDMCTEKRSARRLVALPFPLIVHRTLAPVDRWIGVVSRKSPPECGVPAGGPPACLGYPLSTLKLNPPEFFGLFAVVVADVMGLSKLAPLRIADPTSLPPDRMSFRAHTGCSHSVVFRAG